jgi:hypothetical protein
MWLRQSTASQEISLGPFLDSTDGDTEEGGLTIANTDIKIRKHGATTLANKNSGGATVISNGVYQCTLDATDTDTAGQLEIYVHVAGALAVKNTYVVLTATAFDALLTGTFNNISPSEVNAECDTALTDYDAPTNTELNARTLASADYFDPAADLVIANMTQISGDATAADNLEAMYDGTGYTDDNAPAKQSQLSTLTNVGSAVNKAALSYTLTTGTQSANLFSDTEALDGVRHTHTDAAGAIEFYYEFAIGGGTASSVQVTGYINGVNDDVDVYGYDWVTAGWKQIGNIQGTNSTANSVYSFDLFVDMVGNGADEGKVRVRFFKASGLTSATVAIDQVFVAFSQGVEGYDNGAVWFNSNASNTNTEVNIDGTARNPVSTSAALLSLLASTGLHKIEVTPGSTLTLGGDYEGYDVIGNGSVLALGGQNIGGTVFERFSSVSGVGTSTANPVFFEDCIFATATLPDYIAQQCGFGATITQSGPGDFTHIDCYSTVAGSGSPTFTRSGAGVATAEYRRFSGGITQSGITGSDTFTIGGELGTVTLNGASGDVELRGVYKAVTDNRTGTPTLNLDGAVKGGDVALILADTNELQSDDIPTLIAALPTASEINAEMVDVMEVDTHAQPSSVPAATTTYQNMLTYAFTLGRNKMTQTATTTLLRNDADSATIGTSTVSDDTVTFTKGKFV